MTHRDQARTNTNQTLLNKVGQGWLSLSPEPLIPALCFRDQFNALTSLLRTSPNHMPNSGHPGSLATHQLNHWQPISLHRAVSHWIKPPWWTPEPAVSMASTFPHPTINAFRILSRCQTLWIFMCTEIDQSLTPVKLMLCKTLAFTIDFQPSQEP